MSEKWKVECLRRTPGVFPARDIILLCQKLFTTFEKNPRVKRSRSKDAQVSDLNIVLVGLAESKKLNGFYRKKNKPTDVLSFGNDLPQSGLGELVICMPVIKKQAQTAGHSFKKELDMMVVHGFLHLLGYDHEKNRKEELKMLRLQDRLLRQLT